MAPRKKNPAIKSSGTTSSKASPLPDWVKGGGPKPPPSYTKAGREAKAKQEAAVAGGSNASGSGAPSTAPAAAASATSTVATAGTPGNDGKPAAPQQRGGEREMLFPPGSKTPLNMLYERINKLPGWEKPIVEPRRHRDGYSCAVTLKKVNKKDASNPFTVVFEPKEPGLRLECQSSLEAKHWGATYALFRIFNHLSLNLALPPGPREYWVKMEAYKKEAPSHQDWMWESDPFEAQMKRDAEKAKKEKEKQAAADAASRGDVAIVNGKLNGSGKPLSKAWQEAREVRLASSLREKIEATIRRAMSVFPQACTVPLNLTEEGQASDSPAAAASGSGTSTPTAAPAKLVDQQALEKQLASLGFRPGHARSAVRWLTSARQTLAGAATASSNAFLVDPLLASAANLADREAALEYLMLYTPEEDLPQRFKPSTSSEKFVTASKAGAGGDALAVGWAIDRLSKQGGYPRSTVQACFKRILDAEAKRTAGSSETTLLSRQSKEGLALEMLNRILAGWDQVDQQGWSSQDVLEYALSFQDQIEWEDAEAITSKRADERTAVEAVLGEDRIRAVSDHDRILPTDYDVLIAGPDTPLGGKEDVRLRITSHECAAYPSPGRGGSSLVALPSFCVVSSTLPSYLKLALTQHLLDGFYGATARTDWVEMIEAGDGGVVLAMVEELESSWTAMVDDPPLLNGVMRHLVAAKDGLQGPGTSNEPTPDSSRAGTPNPASGSKSGRGSSKRGGPRSALVRDPDVDRRLQQQQRELHSSTSFSKMSAIRKSLPAAAAASDVLDMIRNNRVVIVAGETGCGKTTQVPQFILDEAISNGMGSECNIVVTQPRRVSAIGVASRVAVERGEDLEGKSARSVPDSSLVGYAIRGERRASRGCRLLFTTTGVLLRRLGAGGDKDLSGISHVIVDEVHERNVDSDFLLLELRELLHRNPKIRVVLMSATINQETFSSYFGAAPCISIPGRTFPVTDYYLEDIVAESRYRPSGNEPRFGPRTGGKAVEDEIAALRNHLANQGTDEETARTVESLARANGGRISYELVGAAVKYVVERAEEQERRGEADSSVGGAILVFMPGVGEIRQAIDAISTALRSTSSGGKSGVEILPLHANLSSDEQRRVFLPVAKGRRKIVVSTNVAETSITIPDVSYVVDTGRVKETRFEPESGLTRLVECWASRAACRQRRGRAGRVRAGECYRLYTRYVEEKRMAAQQTPEMRRVPLESLFLEVKSMREDEDVREYLNRALDPPSLASMDSALTNLIEVGALSSDQGFKSRLTALGKHLAQLPLDLRLAKLLIMATIFGCLGPMLTVASIMSCKPLFTAPFEKREEVSKARASFSNGCRSDLLTDAAAFARWAVMRAERRPNSEIREFCESNFLSQATLREIQTTRLDLLSHLQEMGFVPRQYSPFGAYTDAVLDANSEHEGLLRSLILSGLWPSVIRIDLPSAKFDQSSSGTVQRQSEARQLKYFDPNIGRVFLHPSSTLFSANGFDSSYLVNFAKTSSGSGDAKVYLRDATEVPLFGLLLFGGKIKINHFAGGITSSSSSSAAQPTDQSSRTPGHGTDLHVRLRANARIGVLSAQLRRLLDAVLEFAIDNPIEMHSAPGSTEVIAIIAEILQRDGLAA
ncbi:P-loop containing nucleoside triphosphate hydrolase protein [Testicularia cyperi]|uniref:P-loop containing nucleoside triphosphate hydrolase protein n=1 Tax=Testicularia cyperi TaxID=1882483 RepID=A0A317XSS8_9BASI|nr:P-loop containing nucleoside triphosphate hydrolase protein [Testicularia cyperi]